MSWMWRRLFHGLDSLPRGIPPVFNEWRIHLTFSSWKYAGRAFCRRTGTVHLACMPDFDEDENSLANYNPRLEWIASTSTSTSFRPKSIAIAIRRVQSRPPQRTLFPWQLGVRNFTDLPSLKPRTRPNPCWYGDDGIWRLLKAWSERTPEYHELT